MPISHLVLCDYVRRQISIAMSGPDSYDIVHVFICSPTTLSHSATRVLPHRIAASDLPVLARPIVRQQVESLHLQRGKPLSNSRYSRRPRKSDFGTRDEWRVPAIL